MSWPFRLLATLLLLMGIEASHGALAAATVELLAPRAFGYFIGDRFTHEAIVRLDPGSALDPASLPRPGPLTYWLDLVSVDLEKIKTAPEAPAYRLRLTYQTFYAPLEPKLLKTPALTLSTVSPEGRTELAVPAWPFLMSPLREIIPARAGASMALQPDAAARPHRLAMDERLAFASAGVAAAALAGLAWLRGWRIFRRRQRPFGAAARKVARCAAEPASAEAYLGALLALHRAFDAAAGRRLLADDLAGFLDLRPGFRSSAAEIAQFFAASREAFFGAGAGSAEKLLSARDLDSLARRLAGLERAGA